MKKSIVITLALALFISGIVFACASPTTIEDPVALTVAAIDIQATTQWHDDMRTQTLEAVVSPEPNLKRVVDFNLNTDNTLEETLVYNSGGIKVVAFALRYGGDFGPVLSVLIENASDTSISIKLNEVAVNGFMLPSSLETSVSTGKSSLEDLLLPGEALQRSGIKDIHSIAFSLGLTENENWSKSIVTERILVNTNASSPVMAVATETGELLVEREGIQISLKKMDRSLFVYVENNTDTDIWVHARDLKVNDFLVRYRYREELMAGAKSFQELLLDADDMTAHQIEAVTKIELRFVVTKKVDQSKIFETELFLVQFD